ncbi:MAG: pyridoxal-dependent decarboxylase [Acidimicrobiales bacterium]|jgi:aromatic-L-amino-acid decarboxylase
MFSSESFLVTPEDLRHHGRRTIDWVADYLSSLESYPVLAKTVPGEIAAMLPRSAPEEPEPFEALLADLDRIVLPGTTHWQSPGFFGFFPASASPPAILGELVAAGLAVNGMVWATSPACTEIETVVLDWLVELLGLPVRFRSQSQGGGVIQDSASSATLCALLAARERAMRGNAALADLCVYTSVEAHSSVQKGARVAGFSPAHTRLVAADETFAMDPAALESAVRTDREAGLVPCCVVATAGTTSSMGFDPIRAIGELCRAEQAWLHVDAAMAGSAAVCPELRSQHDGLELADSYAFNPHKWLLTNFDCDCFYVADRASLIDALSITPEYLRNDASESGAVIDYRDWQVPLGRRFRALKLWFVLRSYGGEGLRRHVREHVRLSDWFTGVVAADPRFELCAPPALNLTCFRHVGGDEVSERLLSDLNATGRVFLSHTRLAGRYVIRCCIGGTWTAERHVEMLWRLIDELAPAL